MTSADIKEGGFCVDSNRQQAFAALRALDEEICASAGYVGCCDAHAQPTDSGSL